MMHVKVPGDRSGTLAGIEPLASLLLLMVVELRLPAELGALGSRSLPAGVGASHDAMAFVLRQRTQEGDEASADWRGEV